MHLPKYQMFNIPTLLTHVYITTAYVHRELLWHRHVKSARSPQNKQICQPQSRHWDTSVLQLYSSRYSILFFVLLTHTSPSLCWRTKKAILNIFCCLLFSGAFACFVFFSRTDLRTRREWDWRENGSLSNSWWHNLVLATAVEASRRHNLLQDL